METKIIFEPKSWSQTNKFDLVFLKLKNRKPLYLLGISDFSWLGARTDSNRHYEFLRFLGNTHRILYISML